ncbi:hypothetical protein EWM64_g5 [Hericium alpestre]|uniref:Dilute domain-containing protein n=1 Tax=Hericium alpestre TaxID=135208 RepID=A0A4Z0AB33_9AGAM|nr:hypothetical protein EWM64_g5 [Hericium alpestre]
MASSSVGPIDLSPEPDLHPIYPTPSYVAPLLSPHSGLTPSQKSELVAHSLYRAAIFGELSLFSLLLTDRHAQAFVDLAMHDEDGLGLISTTILGFGSESERDVEREECVRLLISEGADVSAADNAGWTALHHAALMAPPTLVSYLLTHGCSPFSLTRRKLMPLDIVTAHSTMPGREDVALLIGEAMRGEGWTGGRMEDRRKSLEKRMIKKGKQNKMRDDVGQRLGISPRWWGDSEWDAISPEVSDDEDEDDEDEQLYTPPPDYTSMLVFSPPALPDIFQSLITNFQPSLRNSEPANSLYMLARFACLTCDNNWLEDLIIGATDAIEETFFNRSEDLTCLIFWLYNTTAWLHLMRCDNSINETCELLGSFVLIEEVINSVFVFIIRFIERRIDQLIDTAILDHSPLPAEFESVQFESDWSFLRSFASKKKNVASNHGSSSPMLRNGNNTSPKSSSRPPSPGLPAGQASPVGSRSFQSIRASLQRSRAGSATPLSALFSENPAPPPPTSPHPEDITSFFDAIQTLLTLSGVNPALITQLWSQVIYWVACEIFNRILTRKKYICRSRAVQIGMNLGALEEWVEVVNLPRGVISHIAPVRDLLNWLQCLSSISEFANLVATIQTMKHLNPLQMRRAVRDYKYEVNEGRMTEECSQYLAQLQKDWERHRVKLGVEALRREMGDREREREELASLAGDTGSYNAPSISSSSTETSIAQRNIDLLFDRDQDASSWEPAKSPEVLGEFLDSRYMLPLLLPSDPRMLSAAPKRPSLGEDEKRHSGTLSVLNGDVRSSSRASRRRHGTMPWQTKTKRLRDVGLETLQWVDGIGSASRWTRPVEPDENEEDEEDIAASYSSDDPRSEDGDLTITTQLRRITPLTQKPSLRSKRGTGSRPSNLPTTEPLIMDLACRIFRNAVKSVGTKAAVLVLFIEEDRTDWCEQFTQEGYSVFQVIYPTPSSASLTGVIDAAATYVRNHGGDWGIVAYGLFHDDMMNIRDLVRKGGLETLKACVYYNPVSEDGDPLLIQDVQGKVVPTIVHISSTSEHLHASLQDLASKDIISPPERPRIEVYSYPMVPVSPPFPFLTKAPAAIVAGEPLSIEPHVRSANSLAYSRTLALLKRQLGPYYNLEELWEKHTFYEFAERDAAKTMKTMVDTPYVNHVPTMTGGVGHDELARFYKYHFTQVSPPDTEMITVSRTVGADRIIDEMIFKGTHTTEIDYLLPNVKPTGKPFEIALVGVVAFRGDKLTFEHIYWDQASLLVQLGLLDPTGLPVPGVEAAQKVLDPFGLPSNTLMPRWKESDGLSID